MCLPCLSFQVPSLASFLVRISAIIAGSVHFNNTNTNTNCTIHFYGYLTGLSALETMAFAPFFNARCLSFAHLSAVGGGEPQRGLDQSYPQDARLLAICLFCGVKSKVVRDWNPKKCVVVPTSSDPLADKRRKYCPFGMWDRLRHRFVGRKQSGMLFLSWSYHRIKRRLFQEVQSSLGRFHLYWLVHHNPPKEYFSVCFSVLAP